MRLVFRTCGESVKGRKGRASFRRACLSLAGHERRDAQNDATQIGAQRSHGA